MNDDHEDLLAHRALAGTATPDDWASLDALAARDAAVWERLARALRDDRELAAAVAAATAPAARVEIPNDPAKPAPSPRPARRGAAAVSGWLAAAAIALAAALSHLSAPKAPAGSRAPRSETVAELPKVYLRSRRGPEGLEVLFVRRLVERALVSGVVELRTDDAGHDVAVPAELHQETVSSTL